MAGFEAPPQSVLNALGVVTGDDDLFSLRFDVDTGLIGRSTGLYIMEEAELKERFKNLYDILHGRAYIVDRRFVIETSSSGPYTFYVAANKHNGLIIPGRSLFIESVDGTAHYRWTDDGEKWTEWTTINSGEWHSFSSDEHCRFAEIQVYMDTTMDKITLRVTR